MCIPVSLTVLGLVKAPEDAIQGLNQSVDKVALYDNSRITEGSNYATVWCPRTVHKIMGHLGWLCRKVSSKKITNVEMYLIEGTQNNCLSNGVTTWTFNIHLESPLHNPQPWRHAVGVVDGFFFHLDNEDKQLFRYPISLLAGKDGQVPQHTHHYFLRILKVLSIKPKGQYEWDRRKIHSKQLKIDVGCFCVGNGQCKNWSGTKRVTICIPIWIVGGVGCNLQ